MLANRFVPGQRWLSQTEPELGLGLVLKMEPDRVTIVFPSSETTRVYTIENPPLTRVKFSVGDVLKTQDGREFVVEDLEDKDGLVTYFNKGKRIEESQLSDSLTFSKPFDRLLNAQVDDKPVYNLRHRALYRRFKTLRAPLRGFLNGRFNPRPHQLHVAVQATRGACTRVLLADEQGMGKTVEAGLILQRLLTFGNADRTLLLAPAALLDTLELEFSRRFDLAFARVIEEDFAPKPKPAKKAASKKSKGEKSEPAVAPEEPPYGPFYHEEYAWLSCAIEDICGHRGKRAQLAAEHPWDTVIIAGGECLEWNEEGGNAAYQAVRPVAAATRNLIILSDAGPEQDAKHHFGRLHLLDPEAYPTPRKTQMMRKEREALENSILTLVQATSCDKECDAILKPLGAEDPKVKELHKQWKEGREEAKEQVIDHLLDGQELGRSVFRNTRRTALNIPAREVELVKLEARPEVKEGLKEEFKAHRGAAKTPAEPSKGKLKAEPSVADAVLAQWLASLVNPAPVVASSASPAEGEEAAAPAPAAPPPTALIMCSTRARGMAIEKALRGKVQGRVELVTPEVRGVDDVPANVVIVADEDLPGRGFPGMDLCVLWDTPLTFQEAATRLFAAENSKRRDHLRVVVPLVEETPQEMVARWLHEGLNAFGAWTAAQEETAAEFSKQVYDVAKRLGAKPNPKLDEELAALVKKTIAAHDARLKKIDKHRDHFLEAVSCRRAAAEQAMARMKSTDEDDSLDVFMNRTLEQLGILVETKSGRTVVVKPNPEASFRLEDIPPEGITICYSRSTAMVREDAHFLTWDHDLIKRATDRLLSTAIGNTAYVVWEDERAQIVLLEGIFLATPPGGDHPWQVSRYMPPTPVRVVISHEFEDMSAEYTSEMVNKMVRNGRREWLRNNARPLYNLVPGMLRALTRRAEAKMKELSAKAAHHMEMALNADIARIKRLPSTSLREAEIKRIEGLIADLKVLLSDAVLSLDQLRLLRRGPSGKGI